MIYPIFKWHRYNKREEDFPSLREYNDYLEEVEDMSKPCYGSCSMHASSNCIVETVSFLAVFNLIEGIDVPAIEAKIAQYQRENAEQIMIAQARKVGGKTSCTSYLWSISHVWSLIRYPLLEQAEEYAAALAASKGQPNQAENDAVSTFPGLQLDLLSVIG